MCQKAYYIHVCGHRSWGPLNRCDNRYVCPEGNTHYYPVYLTSPCRFCRTPRRGGGDAGRGRGRGRTTRCSQAHAQAQNSTIPSPISQSHPHPPGYSSPNDVGEPGSFPLPPLPPVSLCHCSMVPTGCE
ncbi:hypothetical protein H112_05802 [Trichophyton rubrum D6]|uniref:Uncharacterized protein n=3 Tax=Trichophyton TaxID=5550 RepID=F2SKH6_TRIRC|nr:uncharacterized protein TERG_03512 [Trichophyton rubrum CBS 118892]EZF16366.1 hypothetical protein H100_05819 [Trichophyton rubrum MR850]EZF40198.1 hypothetical protein H102_05788 [Trichophyton rubrum CBS 100081]EZF51009.1 hypothetical protein H103_05814 [Trichophyton rubrum CBS 288.86]EZF61433.1 hypothetical protein H104_05799 [Trichophyton rubrum CBS 289.86]EZF72114.1 hypothetical protein H105_05828 [Trichophyton soudanense CBS 452.61]EZF82744.1 hypothetical protein H110_05807 [Trichophy